MKYKGLTNDDVSTVKVNDNKYLVKLRGHPDESKSCTSREDADEHYEYLLDIVAESNRLQERFNRVIQTDDDFTIKDAIIEISVQLFALRRKINGQGLE